MTTSFYQLVLQRDKYLKSNILATHQACRTGSTGWLRTSWENSWLHLLSKGCSLPYPLSAVFLFLLQGKLSPVRNNKKRFIQSRPVFPLLSHALGSFSWRKEREREAGWLKTFITLKTLRTEREPNIFSYCKLHFCVRLGRRHLILYCLLSLSSPLLQSPLTIPPSGCPARLTTNNAIFSLSLLIARGVHCGLGCIMHNLGVWI